MHGGDGTCGGPPTFDLVTGADYSPGPNLTNYAMGVSPFAMRSEAQIAPLTLMTERVDHLVFPASVHDGGVVTTDGRFNLPVPNMFGGSRGYRRR